MCRRSVFSLVQQKGKMTIFLAMAVFAVTTSAPVQDAPTQDTPALKPSTISLICTAAGARVSGATKVCYYKCAGKEGAFTTRLYEHCPSWTPRWRLKDHNQQFGPSGLSRK
jgi:hypothetical protein